MGRATVKYTMIASFTVYFGQNALTEPAFGMLLTKYCPLGLM